MNSNWLTAIFPLIGVGISLILLKKLFNNKLKRGVGFILRSILTEKSRMALKHTFGHVLTSSVTVAMGGSVGLEAPIVATGSAIGSNTAHDLRLPYRDTTLLLACGASSGIAAIFNSPIAGIIFALEVLMIDFNIPFVIPLLISTATATVVSQLLYPDKFFFLIIEGWNVASIPFYIILGSICGLASVYTTNVVEKIEDYFDMKGLNWKSWLRGSIPLCILIFILPGLYGEGYATITQLMKGNYEPLTSHTYFQYLGNKHVAIIVVCLLLIAFKSVSAGLTIGAGGNGGIFAPSLFIGGIVGFLFAYIVNLTGLVELNTANFIVASMAGVLAGVMHAPLTAIFLLAEITGGYTLFIPLMIVTAISYFMTRKYVKYSLYHKALVEKKIIKEDSNITEDYI
ncbi:MAG: chloride channel protein [Chitinophagales bacterium]|nr:chloride channel protein [Chitinophagaceae bacterium]MCB9064618.1 chloride channel protein [Chitinophagales bacterium]